MNAYDVKILLDTLDTARIYAGSEFERLCNNNQHIDACVFQSIRDNIAQNIQLIQSYVICTAKSESQESEELMTEGEIYDIDYPLEQEPKAGHWIVEIWNNREHHTCSACQKVVDYEPCYHYCPYCGADMRGD